jgi:hypothetical protein
MEEEPNSLSIYQRGSNAYDQVLRINLFQNASVRPHCRELNKPDAPLMSFQAYQKDKEEREKKDQEILELKERMDKMQQVAELNYK